MSQAPKKYTPREAMALARQLGWDVQPKRKSGEIVFRPPEGGRFTCQAPGRTDRVPLVLARALQAAQSKEDKGDAGGAD